MTFVWYEIVIKAIAMILLLGLSLYSWIKINVVEKRAAPIARFHQDMIKQIKARMETIELSCEVAGFPINRWQSNIWQTVPKGSEDTIFIIRKEWLVLSEALKLHDRAYWRCPGWRYLYKQEKKQVILYEFEMKCQEEKLGT